MTVCCLDLVLLTSGAAAVFCFWPPPRFYNENALTQLLETIKSKLALQVGAGIESVWVQEDYGKTLVCIETSDVCNATLNQIFNAQHEIQGAYENFYFVINCVELEEKRKNKIVWRLL